MNMNAKWFSHDFGCLKCIFLIHIYLHENHTTSTIHVGKYTSPMDGMGLSCSGQIISSVRMFINLLDFPQFGAIL